MSWWAWALLTAGFILLVVAASMIQAHVDFSRVENNDRITVQIRGLYGLLRYKFEIPVIKFKGLLKGISLKMEHVNEANSKLLTENTGTINQEKVVRFYRKFNDIIQATLGMKDWIVDTMAYVKCTELKWDTRVGIGDAPETAITTGIIWTLKSSVLAYLFQYMCRETQPQIRVMPQYNQITFSTEMSIAFRIRMVHAIIAGIHLLSRIHKAKNGFRIWQNVVVKPLLKSEP